MRTFQYIRRRLIYLKREIENERISYSEILELQSLKDFIPKDDTILLEWSGIKEGEK